MFARACEIAREIERDSNEYRYFIFLKTSNLKRHVLHSAVTFYTAPHVTAALPAERDQRESVSASSSK